MMIKKLPTSFYWLFLISLASLGAGLYLDVKGFFVNIFAGIVGALIGVWISIGIIEQYLESRQVKEWSLVQRQLLVNLKIHLNESVVEYLRILPSIGNYSQLLANIGNITQEKIDLIDNLIIELRNKKGLELSKTSQMDLYKRISQQMILIKDIQSLGYNIPGQKKELLVLIQELDLAMAEWANTVALEENISINVDALSQKALETLTKIRDILEHLLD